MKTLNMTVGTTYRIEGLRDAGTGLTDYSRWHYHGLKSGWHTFSGSTADQVYVARGDLHRVGRQHLAVRR